MRSPVSQASGPRRVFPSGRKTSQRSRAFADYLERALAQTPAEIAAEADLRDSHRSWPAEARGASQKRA
jgi:hypothetical protein